MPAEKLLPTLRRHRAPTQLIGNTDFIKRVSFNIGTLVSAAAFVTLYLLPGTYVPL